MGIYLSSGESDLSVNLGFDTWRNSLILAMNNGWKPRGTRLGLSHMGCSRRQLQKAQREWSGRYGGLQGLIVGRQDAKNLGKALERAKRGIDLGESNQDPVGAEFKAYPALLMLMDEIIGLCRAGAFTIS